MKTWEHTEHEDPLAAKIRLAFRSGGTLEIDGTRHRVLRNRQEKPGVWIWTLERVSGGSPSPPSVPPGQFTGSISVNSVYENGPLMPELEQLPGVWVARHLRMEGPKEGMGREATEAAVRQLVSQARALASDGTEGLRVIISTDGAAGWFWVDSTERVLEGIRPYGASFEAFLQGASQTFRREKLNAQSLRKGERGVTWARRARAAAAGVRPIRGPLEDQRLGGASPTYGLIACSAHDIEAYFDWLEEMGCNFTRIWAIEMWTALDVGGGRFALSPWERVGRKWNLAKQSEEFFDRLALAQEIARRKGIVLQIAVTDRSGYRNRTASGHWRTHPFNRDNATSNLGIAEEVPHKGYPWEVYATEGRFWEEVMVPYLVRMSRFAKEGAMLEVQNESRPDAAPNVLEWNLEAARILGGGSP